MRTLKNILFLVFIIAFAILIPQLVRDNQISWFLAICIVLGFLVFAQLALRSNLYLKTLFTSKFNIFTSKHVVNHSSNLSSDLLFKKVKEELTNQGFKKIQTDSSRGLLFAEATITFKSWGENLYFTIEEVDENHSNLRMESVAFQLHSWGKNEDNAKAFFAQLEESLVI